MLPVQLFCDGLQALLLALDGSSAPQAHMQHSVDIRTALAVQRRVIDQLFASSDGLTNCATLFTHITEHNLRQPWALTLQMHALVLVREPIAGQLSNFVISLLSSALSDVCAHAQQL